MKPRQLITLIVILFVLVALVWVKQTHKPHELSTQEYVPLELSFDPAQVTAIELLKPKGEQEEYIELIKEDEKWKLKSLNHARVEQQKIDDFLKELKNAKGEMRGRSKELFGDFGIGDDEAFSLRLHDANNTTILDLQLGVKKSSSAIFIRRTGTDEVYYTGADIFGKIGIFSDPKESTLDHNYWANTSLIELDPAKVLSIEGKRFKDGKEIITTQITRQPKDAATTGTWRFARGQVPFDIDPEKVKSFVESFKTWRAQKILDPKAQDFGFDQPQWQMVFEVEGSDPVILKAGKTNEDKTTYIYVSTEPVVFQMSPYYYENMDADDSRFIIDNPLKVDKTKTELLILTVDKKRFETHPQQKSWEGLNNFMDQLLSLRPTRLIFDEGEKKKIKSPSKYSIEIRNKDQEVSTIVDFGEPINDAKDYAVTLRGTNYPFVIANYNYNLVFDNLSRLEAPPAASTAAASTNNQDTNPKQ